MTVVTRFAPSPTGYLHIGGARTALFNWLFAKHHDGKFLLRIEDTDRARSTDDAVRAIKDGMTWLGLDWDGEAVSQFSRASHHAEVARQLLKSGKAYKCYCSPDELTEMRELARKEGRPIRYDGRWRDRDEAEAPADVDPVIRFRAPKDGSTEINDLIQGLIKVENDQLDDMVLLRADGTPTYMLAVVVDDHDMGVTHAIRGDDHLTNAFRQTQLYLALGWKPPLFAHMSLIHGADGAKLSKRHGALGVEAYRDMGFLPEALSNYLLRLGWAHGDDEIISREDAIAWFDLDAVGKAASRFDAAKLTNLNGHYLRVADDDRLAGLVMERLSVKENINPEDIEKSQKIVKMGMPGLKERAKTIVELADNAEFYITKRPLPLTDKAAGLLDDKAREMLACLQTELTAVAEWRQEGLEDAVRVFATARDMKLGKVAQPLRAALCGATTSPGIFDVMNVLGRDETLGRLGDVTKKS